MHSKLAVWLVVMMLAAPSVALDYIAERDAAMELLGSRKYEKALERFMAMAEAEVSENQKTDALEQAIICLIALERHERGRDLVKQIPVEASADASRIRIMLDRRQYEKLLEQFGDAAISNWPDYLKADTYAARGRAAHRTGNGELAEADYTKALTWEDDGRKQTDLRMQLADVYHALREDDTEALRIYRQLQDSGLYSDGRATIRAVNILIEQDRGGEALREIQGWLTRHDIENLSGNWWPGHMRLAHARALAAAGHKDKAVARVEEMQKLEKIHPALKRDAGQMLAKLRGQSGDESR